VKIFMFNHAGSLNRGCEAIVKGTVNVIENAYPGNEYILSSFSPNEDKELKGIMNVVPFKPKPLNKTEHIIAAVNIRLKHDERYSILKSYSEFFEDARPADICLSVGGDTYCYGDNSATRILTGELKKRGKKVVLWGASIGEEDLSAEKEKNLACFDAIFARESLTYDLIKKKGLNQNVFLFPDPAFTLEQEELPLPDGWQVNNTVGINLSPIAAGKNPNLLKITNEFIANVLTNTDMSIALIPHVTSPLNNDMTPLEALYNGHKSTARGRLLILPGNLSAAQYKGYIARLKYFVATRTHASLAAYTSCVPTIVLGYSVKSRGIARDIFGSDRFVLDINKINNTQVLLEAFKTLRAQENEIKSIYKEKIPLITKDAYSSGWKLMEICCRENNSS